MKKTGYLLIPLLIFVTFLSSCALLSGTLDKRTGFSQHLKDTENSIGQEDWSSAALNLKTSEKTWKKLKPILQIDIDHDYVNDIENNFVMLYSYIESRDKADSLATIRLIQENWKSIGEM